MQIRTLRSFQLPASTVFVVGKRSDGKHVAHSIDFDLVAVADTAEEADAKLRFAIQTYLEFGLAKGWQDFVLFRAPVGQRWKIH